MVRGIRLVKQFRGVVRKDMKKALDGLTRVLNQDQRLENRQGDGFLKPVPDKNNLIIAQTTLTTLLNSFAKI